MLPTLTKHDPNKREQTLRSGLTAPTSRGCGGMGAVAGRSTAAAHTPGTGDVTHASAAQPEESFNSSL